MDEYGKVVAPGTVRIERLLPGPVERVWAYLTESEKRAKWLAEGQMTSQVGSSVELRFDHGSLSSETETPEQFKDHEGAKGTEQITRWEPPHVLGLTWGPSEVTFELSAEGDKVRLVLTHQKLPNREWMIDVSSGWHSHLGILEDQLAGVDPRPFWTTILQTRDAYAERIPMDQVQEEEKR